MKVEVIDGSPVREILGAMIVDRTVLARIAGNWDGKLFSTPQANRIGGWCVDYLHKYGEAPGKTIKSILNGWSDSKPREEEFRETVELATVAWEDVKDSGGEGVNSARVIDLAGAHFNVVRLHRLKDAIEAGLLRGRPDKAQEAVNANRPVEMGLGAGIDLFKDEEEVRSTFERKESDLVIEYDGALGEFFGDHMERDGFVAFMAPDKAGKTFFLIDAAYRAMRQRKKVAFFACGDMSARQMKSRLLVRNSVHPLRSTNDDGSWPCKVLWPSSFSKIPEAGNEEEAELDREVRKFSGPLDRRKAWEDCESLVRSPLASRMSFFRMSVHPNSSVSVENIRSTLQSWDQNGFVADCVVIDYADILAPEPSARRMDARDQIDMTWRKLSALRTERHCLVVTATQSDAKAYTQKGPLGRSNFSNDKRKLSHCTGMVGINVSEEAKRNSTCYLNWIVLREGHYESSRGVVVGQCLPVGNPAVLSAWPVPRNRS